MATYQRAQSLILINPIKAILLKTVPSLVWRTSYYWQCVDMAIYAKVTYI